MLLAQPKYLWLFLVMIPLIAWYILKQRNSRPTLAMSSTAGFAHAPTGHRAIMRHVLFVLRLGIVACLIIVICRPQKKDEWNNTPTYGTDIVIALDVSPTMTAKDFSPNRLEAAKKVAIDFVDGRNNDNIGLVMFASESLTGMPMTVDHDMLKNYISSVNPYMLGNGTAIGDGIATALNRLQAGKAESKTLILITDGDNNTGVITPSDAAKVAKELGVKIYTIGVGTNGPSLAPSAVDMLGNMEYSMQDVPFNEKALTEIAAATGGQYFRASNERALSEIFNKISAMTQTQMDVRHFSHTEDNYALFGWLALLLLVVELTLRFTIVRTMP